MEEIFESSTRRAGDLAGVFEFDGSTSYFYLYRVNASEDHKILCAVYVSLGDFSFDGLEIGWSSDENLVFLRVAGVIRAAFDCEDIQGYGGNDLASELPPAMLARLPDFEFKSRH